MTEIPPPPPMGMPAGNEPHPQGKGMAIASVIVGIVSVALCLYWFISVPAGIVAVVLGVLARKRGVGAGLALGGIITGAVGFVFGLVIAILSFAGGGFLDGFCDDNADNPFCTQQGY